MTFIRFAQYSLAATSLFVASKPASAGEIPVPVGPYVSQIIEARTLAESYVFVAKDHLARAGSDYRAARRKYACAHRSYSAYLGYLEDAVRRGNSTQLGEDPKFLHLSQSASDAGKQFVMFVDAKTPPSRANSAQLYLLKTAGIRIGEGTSDATVQRRIEFVKTLDGLAKWHSWSDLTSSHRDSR